MAIEVTVNGEVVSLPDIPADVLAEYPYAVIFSASYNGSAFTYPYVLVCMQEQMLYASADIAGAESLVGFGQTIEFAYNSETAAWMDVGTGTHEYFECEIGVYWDAPSIATELIWSNHDIYEMDADGNATEIIYFANSTVSYDDEYIVKSAFLIAMADKAREVSATTDRLTTDKIQAAFDTLHSADGVEFG